MRKGKEGEALLLYIDPKTSFRTYDKVLLDPVTIWINAERQMTSGPVSIQDKQRLADMLYAAIKEALEKDYTLVRTFGPDTMRVRVAITELRASTTSLDTISNIPILRLPSNVRKLSSGTHSFVGRVAIEGELTDAVTRRRLAAAVDRRTGGKTFIGASKTWDDVEQSFKYWAQRLRARLAELRKR
jgi:hypothetical protein